MKSLFSLAFLLVILFSQSITAQEKMVARDGFQEGFKAMQFGIGDNFRLTSFGGTHFSFVRFESDNKSTFVRAYLNLNYFKEENEQESENEFPMDSQLNSQFIDENTSNEFNGDIRVYLGNTSYIETKSDVLPYFSKSIFIGTGINSSTDENSANELDTPTDRRETNRSRFVPQLGAAASFGIEFFIAKNISLLAQSGLEFRYAYINDESDFSNQNFNTDGEIFRINKQSTNNKNHYLNLNSTGVIFGLTAYF